MEGARGPQNLSPQAGEKGSFIAEFAAMQPRARVIILHSTKFLANNNWLSHNMRALYAVPHPRPKCSRLIL
jgi:hypothetical protein